LEIFNFFFDSALVQEHEGKREKAGVLPRSVGDQTMMSARARVIAARVLAQYDLQEESVRGHTAATTRPSQ
jgi:hypothetical protein